MAARIEIGRLDDRYDCFVERSSDAYAGQLVVKDGEREVLRRGVTIAFGAPFGPDAGDMDQWEGWATDAVDGDTKGGKA